MIDVSMHIILVALVAFFLGSFVKGAVGFGLPMIATPILIFFLPLPVIVAITILPILVANVQQCWMTRHYARILLKVWPMIVANVVILFFGSQFIVSMNNESIRFVIGILIILHALVADSSIIHLPKQTNVKLATLISGVASGVLGSISSFYSFPSVQLLYAMRLKPDEFVFAIGALLMSGFFALWAGIAMYGFPVQDWLWLSALIVLPVIAGIQIGSKARSILSASLFRSLIKLMLIASGITLISKSFMA